MYISVPIHCFCNFLTTMKGIWEFTSFVLQKMILTYLWNPTIWEIVQKTFCWMVHCLWLKHYLPTSCFIFCIPMQIDCHQYYKSWNCCYCCRPLIMRKISTHLKIPTSLRCVQCSKSKNANFQCYQGRPWIVGRNISSWVHNTWFSFSFLWEQTIWIFSCAPTRGYWITTNQGINLPFGQNSQLIIIIIPSHGNHTTLTIFPKWQTSFVKSILHHLRSFISNRTLTWNLVLSQIKCNLDWHDNQFVTNQVHLVQELLNIESFCHWKSIKLKPKMSWQLGHIFGTTRK